MAFGAPQLDQILLLARNGYSLNEIAVHARLTARMIDKILWTKVGRTRGETLQCLDWADLR
jgi:hypothetical protein